jgi:hypothetical protein
MAEQPRKPVGYGSPPVEHQFKKNQPSANPRGRPRKDKAFGAMVRDQLNRKIAITVGGKRRRVPINQVIVQQLLKKAAEGDLVAMREVIRLNLLVGPPPVEGISLAEMQERQAAAEKMKALLIDALEMKAARKKRDQQRKLPPGAG